MHFIHLSEMGRDDLRELSKVDLIEGAYSLVTKEMMKMHLV